MRISISNIGHVESADIEVNSIAIIAGNNNTGKSTVGKTLYATATGLNLLEPLKILREKAEAIVRRLSVIVRLTGINSEEKEILNEIQLYCLNEGYLEEFQDGAGVNLVIAEDFSAAIDEYFSEAISKKIDNLFARLIPKAIESKSLVLQDLKKDVDELIQKSINDENFKVNIMQKVFDAEFSTQISHVNELEAESNVTIKELNQQEININFKENKIQTNKSKLDTSRTFSKALYVDNPFVLDTLNGRLGEQDYSHAQFLRTILSNRESLKKQNLFELDNREGQIERIFQHVMNEGKLVWKDGNHYFENAHIDSPLYFGNLSTGLKSFSIIYMLLKSNNLDECEYLILDEPEIHLHPDWQLKFAELLVLISKKFNLKLIITSHSPYFIEAIELYSKRHDYYSDVRFYRTKNSNTSQRYIIENVTNNVKKLYDDLANAFYSLEEIREQEEEQSYDD